MWNTIIELFRNYMGTGLIVAWFIVAVIYLFLKEKDKSKRIIFLYMPVIMLLLFFNPVFGNVILNLIGDEIYYRILWLLPMTIVLAYTITVIYSRLQGARAKVFLGISAVLIVVSGSCVYRNAGFGKADNLYHMPQEVVDICDAIKVEGREVMAVFPGEMITYVRQYEPTVCMPYGREVLVDRWGMGNEFYKTMEADVIAVEELATMAKQYKCHYVILSEEKELEGTMEDYDYILYDTIEGYSIYLDTTMYLGLGK